MDALWVINLTHEVLYKCVRDKLEEYHTEIDNLDDKNWLCIMHNRKASVWANSLDNGHPFRTNEFALFQNWTMRQFFTKYQNVYKKETDSETMLFYLQEKCKDLPAMVKELDDMNYTYWIIIIIDIIRQQVLIYSDWLRESYIKVQNWLLKEFSNYIPKKTYWFKNVWHMIIDYEWKILVNEFKKPLNTVHFYTYTYTEPTTYKHYNSNSNGYHINTNWQSTLPIANNPELSRLFQSWLTRHTVLILMDNWVTEFEEFFWQTEVDLCLMKWSTTKMVDEIIELLESWDMCLPIWEEDSMVTYYREEMLAIEQEEDLVYAENILLIKEEKKNHDTFLSNRKSKWTSKNHRNTSSNPNRIKKKDNDYFYSEEILNDQALLTWDILCYILRTKNPTLKWYAYEHMWIPEIRSIKKVIWKALSRKMKKAYIYAFAESKKIKKINNS